MSLGGVFGAPLEGAAINPMVRCLAHASPKSSKSWEVLGFEGSKVERFFGCWEPSYPKALRTHIALFCGWFSYGVVVGL